jgi:hypothetical protein
VRVPATLDDVLSTLPPSLEIPFEYPGGTIMIVRAAKGGALEDLMVLARYLADTYSWSVPQAVAFILTGRTPRFHPLRTRVRAGRSAATSRIIIDADPRVPTKEIANAYESAREHPWIARLSITSARPLEQRVANLASFLARHQDASWRERRELWNREHPDWGFGSEWEFSRDTRRAWGRVVGEEPGPVETEEASPEEDEE